MKTLAAVLVIIISAAIGVSADVQSPADLSSVGGQTQETSLGDLISDAVRGTAGTAVSLIPAGGFREVTIPAGTIKPSDVLRCLQYPDDQVVVMRLTGAQLLKALERSVSIYPQKNMGFLQVSGLTVRFDPGSPKESRIRSAMVGAEPVVANQTYRVATTKPLADGAYGYFTIWGSDQKPEMKGKTIAQSATDFLSQRTSVDYRTLNRIVSH